MTDMVGREVARESVVANPDPHQAKLQNDRCERESKG